MAEAKQCDRCGGYFNPEKENDEYCRFSNPIVMDGDSYSDYCVKYKMCVTSGEGDIDLCPKCTWLMKKFMQNKKFVIYMDDGETVEEFMDGYLGTQEKQDL